MITSIVLPNGKEKLIESSIVFVRNDRLQIFTDDECKISETYTVLRKKVLFDNNLSAIEVVYYLGVI